MIRVPSGPDLLCTVTAVVPLQLLAYHVATRVVWTSTSPGTWPRL